MTDYRIPSPISLWFMRGLCLIALGISGYLAYSAFSQSDVVGCGGELFNCDHVLTSRFSKILEVPVSVPAFALYASLLSVLFFMRPNTPVQLRKIGWSFLTFGSISAAAAAIWFIGLQKYELGHYCKWCLGAHSCGIALALTVLAHRRMSFAGRCQISSLAIAGVVAMSCIQWFSHEKEQSTVQFFDDAQSDKQNLAAGPDEFAPPIAGGPDEFAPPVFDAPQEFAPPVFDPPAIADSSEALVDASNEPLQPVSVANAFPEGVQQVVMTEMEYSSTIEQTEPTCSELDEAEDVDTDTQLKPEVHEQDADEQAQDSPSTSQMKVSPTTKLSPSTAAWMFFAANGMTTTQFLRLFPADDTKTQKAPVQKNVAVVPGGKFSLDTRHWPLIGNPQAKYVFVEMFDYTCSHCRITHKAIDGAFEKYGDDLAIIVLPVPLEQACNPAAKGAGHVGACELARIAITVWRLDPKKFRELHHWMCIQSRTASQAKARAEKLVGAEKFRKEFALPHASAYIKRHVQLYQKMGSGTIPKLMFPRAMLTGQVTHTSTLINMIDQELVKKNKTSK